MSQDTANFSTEVHNLQVNSLKEQEFVKNYESFQAYMREGEIADNDLSPEDFKMLDHLQKLLQKEAVMEHDYRTDFDKAKNDLERVMKTNIPVQMKIKLSESIRENLKSKMDCLKEMNKVTKELIMKVEKTNNYSTYLNMIQCWKEASKLGKASSVASTNMSSYTMNSGFNQTLSPENPRKHTQSFLSTQSVNDEMTEEQRMLEETRFENIKLEDMIASLKESRNHLVMGLENMADDMEEYQDFAERKKVLLQETLKRIEDLKAQISTQSSRKSTNARTKTQARPSRGDHERTEISRVNTTVLQDVSTKVTGFFGKMFGKKDKVVVSDKMLPAELFHTDMNGHITTTQGNYTPTNVNYRPKTDMGYGGRSPLSSPTTIKSTKK